MERESQLIKKSKELITTLDKLFSSEEYSLLEVIYIISMTLYIFFRVNGIKEDDFIKIFYSAKDHFKNNEIQA